MADVVVETPVELLVLSDDRTESQVFSELEIGPTSVPLDVKVLVNQLNLDEEDEEEEAANALEEQPVSEAFAPFAVSSPRIVNAPIDTQNLRTIDQVYPSETPVVATDRVEIPSVAHSDEPPPGNSTGEGTQSIASGAVAEKPVPKHDIAISNPEIESLASRRDEPDTPKADTMLDVENFLYVKIVENQCNSHSQEIHEFLAKRMSEVQQAQLLPPIILRLSSRLQEEAAASAQLELSVDIQSSFCIVEQMFLPVGRRSPLQDIYTAEEEEMLDQLGHANSSNN